MVSRTSLRLAPLSTQALITTTAGQPGSGAQQPASFMSCRSAGDGYQAPVGEVGPDLPCLIERQLDAAQALRVTVGGTVHAVHRVIAVEKGDEPDRIGIGGAVRHKPAHDLEAVAQVHREGAVGGRRRGGAGVSYAVADSVAVMPYSQRLP